MTTAIALARKIPSQAEAYDPAQIRIRDWQATLRRIEDARRPAPAPNRSNPPPPAVGENGLPATLELAPARE